MRATARVYWRLLGAGFRRASAYRLAMLGGLVANLAFGLLKVAMLFATVRAAGGRLHGYDTASMSTYIWLSQGMLGSVNLSGRSDLALRVKDGPVASSSGPVPVVRWADSGADTPKRTTRRPPRRTRRLALPPRNYGRKTGDPTVRRNGGRNGTVRILCPFKIRRHALVPL